MVERKIISFLTSSNLILFRTFFIGCLNLYIMYIGISFDARRASEEKG